MAEDRPPDPRLIVTPPPDIVHRTMIEDLADGPVIRVVRLVKNGPLCPCYIGWLHTLYEPGEPNNTMERSPHIAAFLSGEPVAAAAMPRLYASGKAGSSRISRAEYAKQVAEIAANARARRYDPRRDPWSPVDIGQMQPPLF